MSRRPSWLLTIPALVLGLGFFVWPTISILDLGLRQDPGRLLAVISDPGLRSVAWFSLWQACVSTLAALVLGVPAALALARFEFRGRRTIRTVLTLPFVLPTVVVAAAFLALVGPQGVLGFDLAGTVWVVIAAHVFFNLAVVIRTVGGLASHIDPALEDAAGTLGASPWRRLRTVTLPLIRPAIVASGAVVFLFSLTSFGVILLLGAPRLATLEVEIYRSAALIFDLPTAAALALIQLIGVGAALLVYSGRRSTTPQQLVPGARRRPVTGRRRAVALAVAPALVLVILPLGAIAWRTFVVAGSPGLGAFRALARLDPSVVDPLAAIANSLRNGLVAGLIALGVGLPAAHFIAARRSPGASWLDTLIMIPLGASAVTLGFGMVVALDAPIDLRAWWLLIPIAHAVIAVPFVVRIVVPVASAIDPHLRQAAATLGAAPGRIWRTVDLPILTPAITAAAVLAFIVSVGEFGATLFVARPGGQTMTLAIFRLLGRPGGGAGSAALALAMLLIALTAIAVAGLERTSIPGTRRFLMLHARELSVSFGDLKAIDDVSLDVAAGETVALVGRSGSGKTTLLRAIAGLVPLDSGEVEIGGTDVSSLPPHLRNVGLVFQDFALFPHLDVEGNVGYGVKEDRTIRITDALRLVGLDDMGSRPIHELSGGQAQRVALARTLASRPRVLLLDEPMGSLDRAYRRQVADELASLLSATGVPTVLVTHDVEEAFALGDRIVVLEHGAVVAAGPPESVWANPGTPDAARILGHTAIVEAEVVDGLARVDGAVVPLPPGTPNGPVTILIRSARIADADGVSLRIAYSRFSGPQWTTGLHVGGGILEVITRNRLDVGDTAHVIIEPTDITAL